MTPPPALAVRGATKRYGETLALDGVDLVAVGGVFGLLGANGAGKSTLMRAIVDLTVLDAGEVEVDGLPVVQDALEVRRRVGYLPEEPQLDPYLTPRELLALVARLRGAPPDAGAALLDELGVSRHLDVLLGKGSHGVRQKTALAVALLGSPRLVVLDEPTNGLDAEALRRLRHRLEAMTAAGTAFVISSHALGFVERVCDQVAILRRGKVVASGTPAELRQRSGLGEVPFDDVFLRWAVDGDSVSPT